MRVCVCVHVVGQLPEKLQSYIFTQKCHDDVICTLIRQWARSFGFQKIYNHTYLSRNVMLMRHARQFVCVHIVVSFQKTYNHTYLSRNVMLMQYAR